MSYKQYTTLYKICTIEICPLTNDINYTNFIKNCNKKIGGDLGAVGFNIGNRNQK